MLSIGWSELLIVAAIALIVVGPRDLPVMLRHLGRAAGAVRRMGNEFRAEIDKVGAADDLKQLRRSFADPLKAATRDINRQFNKPETAAQPAPREYAEAAAAKAAAAAEADAQSTPSIAADGAPEPKSADDARPAAAQAATGKPKPKRTRKPAKRAAAKPRTAKSASAKSTSAKSTSAKSTSAKSTSAKTSPSRRAASRKPAG